MINISLGTYFSSINKKEWVRAHCEGKPYKIQPVENVWKAWSFEKKWHLKVTMRIWVQVAWKPLTTPIIPLQDGSDQRKRRAQGNCSLQFQSAPQTCKCGFSSLKRPQHLGYSNCTGPSSDTPPKRLHTWVLQESLYLLLRGIDLPPLILYVFK